MLKSRYSQSQPRPFFHYPLPLSGCDPCSENPFNFSLLDSTLWSATAAPVHFRGILSCVSLSSGSQIFFSQQFSQQIIRRSIEDACSFVHFQETDAFEN